MFFLIFVIGFKVSSFCQEAAYGIYDSKLCVKNINGKSYNYFLLVGKDNDTFQVVNRNCEYKNLQESPMLAKLDMRKGVLIRKSVYKKFPFLKRKFKAYYFSKVGLIYV